MKARMEVLLSMWGRWSLRGVSGALGFPSVSPMFRDAPRGHGYGSQIPLGFCDADLEAVDSAVKRLPSVLRLVCSEIYQHGGSMRTVAQRMGVSKDTVTKYLTLAHEKISLDIDSECRQNTQLLDSFVSCVQIKPAPA